LLPHEQLFSYFLETFLFFIHGYWWVATGTCWVEIMDIEHSTTSSTSKDYLTQNTKSAETEKLRYMVESNDANKPTCLTTTEHGVVFLT
jgi:hypothetical protein